MMVQYLEHYISVSDEFSLKDFSNKTLMEFYEVEDFPPGTVIYRSLFYHEKPGTVTFPLGMRGVTFIKCNLDNLILPPDNEYVDCSNRSFKSINGVDTEINKYTGKVIGPLNLVKPNLVPKKSWYKRIWDWIKSWL